MKTLLIYLLLVGLPTAGVVGILSIGRHITPPRSVGGSWRLVMAETTGDRTSCVTMNWRGTPRLTITQSGPKLHLQFDDAEQTLLKGMLQGDTLVAHVTSPSEAPAFRTPCSGTGEFTLKAVATPDTGNVQLHGVLIDFECADCTPVRFTGVRQPQEKD